MENQTSEVNVSTKTCPFCGEQIAEDAQKCKHCGEWLNKSVKTKSFKVTILLSYFLGLLGVHRFYTGYIGIGIAQLFTLGGLGVWSLIDLISISLNKYKDKSGKQLEGYNKTLGIILMILGLLFFFYNGNPYKITKDFSEGSNNTQTTQSTDGKVEQSQQETKQQVKKPDLEVIEHHPCNGDFGSRMVCGTIINNTNRTIGYAQVEINLYDSEGSLVDSTMDNINNLEPNGKWKFKAIILEDNVTNYKIKDVSGF